MTSDPQVPVVTPGADADQHLNNQQLVWQAVTNGEGQGRQAAVAYADGKVLIDGESVDAAEGDWIIRQNSEGIVAVLSDEEFRDEYSLPEPPPANPGPSPGALPEVGSNNAIDHIQAGVTQSQTHQTD